MHHPLAVIGGGNMAQAILQGAVAAHAVDPRRVVVAEPLVEKHGPFAALGVATVRSASDAIEHLRVLEADVGIAGQVLLAVKPQSLGQVSQELAKVLSDRQRVVISILAGTPAAKVRAALGPSCGIVRAMPNTPARIGKGVTALALGDGAVPGDESLASAIFHAVGPVVVTIPESLMDAFTAVASSGPAYLFFLAEAMMAAAVDLGFDQPTADRIVRATLTGSSGLLVTSDQSPAQLRAAVTSKGGTTEAAFNVLNRQRVAEAIVEALRAACQRGHELGQLP